MTNDTNKTSAEVLVDDDIDGVQGGMSGLDFGKASSSYDMSSVDLNDALAATNDMTSGGATSAGSPSDADKAAAALALSQLNSNLAKLRS